MIQTAQIPVKKPNNVVTFFYLLLVEEYALLSKTRTAHQKINESNSFKLNWFLESQYNEIDRIISEINEKTRSFGHFAFEYSKGQSSIDQIDENCIVPDNTEEILELLKNRHKSIVHSIQTQIFTMSGNLKELEATAFISEIMERHKKMANILRLYMPIPSGNQKV